MGQVILFVFAALLVRAQGLNGSVTGVVTDASGAAVPKAEVVLSLADTGLVSRTTTNDSGIYRFPSAAIGVYELSISAGGFKKYLRTGIVLETAQTVRVDASLEIGTTQESVTVSDQAIQLDRETSVVGTQVSREMVSTLPFQLTGSIRNPFQFSRLTPGAVGGSGAGDGIRIAGSRTYSNEVFLDGIPFSYNAGQNVAGPAAPALETVSEFRVEAAVPPAEYGRTAGGAVLMASRSGTNSWHGGVVFLLRNNILDARRYNAVNADITRQGEYSGTIGGPIRKNRTFVFGNYTGFRRINATAGRTTALATAAMRRGDFNEAAETIFDPLTATAAGLRQAFPNRTIPTSRISPLAGRLQSVMPLPNSPGIANNFLGALPSLLNMNGYFIKVDHSFTDRHRVNASFRDRIEDRVNSNGIVIPLSDLIVQSVYPKNVAVGYDWIVRPNLVSRFQIGGTRYTALLRESGDAGIKVPGAFESGFPGVRFGGQGFAGFGYGADRDIASTNSNLLETVAWTKGKHNFKFGGRIDVYRFNQATFGFREGAYTFSQFGTSQPQVARTGHSYASFLLGLVNNANMELNAPTGDRSRYFGLFAQDDWKATRRLTINYGYRWETQSPFGEVHRRLSIMDPDTPNPGAPGRNGAVIFAGSGPGRSGLDNFIQQYYGAHGPRLGFAYQLDGKTVLRAGAGLFYSPLIGTDNNKQGFNSSITVGSLDGGLTPAFNLDQGWPADLIKVAPFIDPTIANNQNVSMIERRRGGSGRLSRTSQYQFSLQRMIAGSIVEASYVGTLSHGITNAALVNVNQLPVSTLALGNLLTRNIADAAVVAAGYRFPYAGFRGTLAQALRSLPQYQTVTSLDTPTGNNTYHGLLVKAEKRLSRGLQFLISYAFTKSIGDISFTNADLARPQDQYNRRAEKSITNVDIPQRFTASFSYELRGVGRAFARQATRAWIVAGILSYESGGALRVTTPNSLPIFNGHLRPNQVPGVPIRSGGGHAEFRPLNALSGERGDLFFNRDAFAAPAPFTLGTLGVVLPNIRSFGSKGEDLSVMRRFSLGEQRRFEVRADFFNAFNRRNLGSPISDLSNPNFGRITGQEAARIVQIGTRFEF